MIWEGRRLSDGGQWRVQWLRSWRRLGAGNCRAYIRKSSWFCSCRGFLCDACLEPAATAAAATATAAVAAAALLGCTMPFCCAISADNAAPASIDVRFCIRRFVTNAASFLSRPTCCSCFSEKVQPLNGAG